MPSWGNILNELNLQNENNKINFLNQQRLHYIQEIEKITNRNVIAYYSAFLQKPAVADTAINDKDINALMENIHGLSKDKGLDLILHTPGGDITATEKIIDYLQTSFNDDIRVIVPQMAMSAGSLISVSCKEIIMGKQSCLGPFDPQIGGIACQSLIREFEQAKDDIKKNPHALGLWQVIVSKYHPTLLLSCSQAISLSEDLAKRLLQKTIQNEDNVKRILEKFNNNDNTKTHSRHISKEECKQVGLNISNLEDNQSLQDVVLSLHHCYMLMFDITQAVKIVENSNAGCYMINLRTQ